MNITFENITLEEALRIIEFASQPKKDEVEKAAKKCATTGNRSDLQKYLKLRLRRNYI